MLINASHVYGRYFFIANTIICSVIAIQQYNNTKIQIYKIATSQ
jgi:hypothetical protein